MSIAGLILQWIIRRRFPNVRSLTTQALADWLAQGDRPLLLDARTTEEFAVSHLPDARLMAPTTLIDATLPNDCLKGKPLDTPIVVYCSVGYRSAVLCDRLQKAGHTNVVNLEGSIFQWANEGRMVYQGDRVVQAVHSYNRLWGLFLRGDRHL